LVTAIADLECAIRHASNRTPTPQNAEFLPSLVEQNRISRRMLAFEPAMPEGR
jgi:hypothetical protein